MLLLEAHGKQLLRDAGIAVPGSELVRAGEVPRWPDTDGGWVVKAQVPVGGRGKAGGIVRVDDAAELPAAIGKVLSTRINGHDSRAVLVEERIEGGEHYLALMIDTGSCEIRLLYSPRGGVEIESDFSETEGAFATAVPATREALDGALDALARALPPALREEIAAVARRMSDELFSSGLLLAEINPLFIGADGKARAGDSKVVVDMNAVPDHPALRKLLTDNRDLYPDAWRKLSEGFDYIELDRDGTIGLVTTGAGLSMMLVDELVAAGGRPINFCDMRTGQMRGKPDRLLRIFDWLQEIPTLKVILINVFAGITDLGEFAELLLAARRRRPELRIPFVVRLVGNGAARAEQLIGEAGQDMEWEPDLERAIARATERAQEKPDAAGS